MNSLPTKTPTWAVTAKILLLGIILIAFRSTVSAQNVNVVGAIVGSGTYPTLGAAFTAINGGAQTGAIITIAITGNTTEPATATLNQNTWTYLTISPSGGAARTISGSVAGSLITLDGADRVGMDGLNTGGNSLTLENTSNSATAATMTFVNDARQVGVQRVSMKGSGAGLTTGVVVIGTGTVAGNDSLVFQTCDFGPSGASLPYNLVYASGSPTAGIENSSVQFSTCNFFDYFNAGGVSMGINSPQGNSDWTVQTCKFYQTANRTYTTGAIHRAISILGGGNNHLISGNTVGYASSAATGTYTMGGTIATRFIGIELGAGTTTASSIQGNTVTAISLTTSSGATTTTGILCGISVTGGNVNIGNITPNIIGTGTGTGALLATPSTSGGTIVGIHSGSTGTVLIQNNVIGGFTSVGSTASIGGGVAGIINSGAGNLTITGNQIGNGAALDNMRAGTLGVTTGSSFASGINLSILPATGSITNNNIFNFASYGTGTTGYVRGIWTQATTASSSNITISGNFITNLKTTSANTSYTNGQCGAVGISIAGGSSPMVSGNTIINIGNYNSTTTSGTTVAGVTIGNAANTTIRNNVIYNLTNLSIGTTTTSPPIAAGVVVRSGTTANFIYNNMISLSNAENICLVGIMCNHGSTPDPVNNIWHNTINIGGAVTSGALPTFGIVRTDWSVAARTPVMNVINNLITNTRSGGTGQHFAIGNNYGAATSSAVGWGTNFSNNNVLNANASTVGWWTGAQTFAGWKTASSSDAASYSGITVTYVSVPTDLHLNMGATPTFIESGGQTIASVPTDIDGQVRPGPAGSTLGGALAPDIGADEIDAAPLDAMPPTITYTPLTFTCSTGNRTFTATISDAISGVPTAGGNVPRVYFRKGAGPWFSNPGTLTAGTSSSGTWSFTISSATMGGLVLGDVVEYYIVAQDLTTPTPNVGANPSAGFSATSVNSITTPPTTPNNYPISGFLTGTYTVGAAGTYPTLTAAVNAYNTSCLSGPVTFSLIDATYASETYPITILSNPDASAVNTLTIKPASGVSASFTGSSATALVILSGADYVIFDGHNGTTVNSVCPRVNASRNLTLTNTNTSTSSGVFSFQTAASGNGATHNTLMNCNIIGSGSLATGVAVNSSGPTIGAGTGANNNNYNSVINNKITAAQVGIFSASAGAPKNKGNVFNLNDLNSPAPNAIGRFGMMVLNEDSVTVHGNLIGNMSNASTNDQVGISLGANAASNSVTTGGEVTNSSVMYNEIDSLVHSATFSAVGILVAATSTGTNMIANNVVSRIWANGTGGDFACGIYYGGGAGAMNIYHNTVDVTGPTLSGASQPNMAIGINGTTPTVDIRNNILMCSGSSGFNGNTGIGLAYTSTVGNYANLTSNYNDIVVSGTSSGVGRTGGLAGGTVRTLLLDWQTETGKDLNSVILPHTFVGVGNYHVSPIPSVALSNLGTPLPAITSDIDCDVRSATTPDMGADEWLPPCSTATVGALLPGDSSFCSADSLLLIASSYSSGVGSTYTWESSAFGAGSFTGTGGSDPDGYSTGVISTPTDFRLVVTCATDGSTAISDILTMYVGDSLAPTTACTSPTFTLGAGGTFTITADTLDGGSVDNCSGSGDLLFTASKTTFDCADIGTVLVTLMVSDTSGNMDSCVATVTILPAALVADVSADTVSGGLNIACFGDTTGVATVNTSGGCPTYSYIWSDGQTTATATGLSAGTYTVTVTDGAGQADTLSITLTEPSSAVIGSSVATEESCVPGADGSIDLTASGGTPGYTYLWSNGATTEDISGLTAGSYTVTITDAAGCTYVNTETVSLSPGPGIPVITQSNDTLFSSITDPSYTYQWFVGGTPVAGGTDTLLTPTPNGSYTLVVTDSLGCTDTSMVFLVVGMDMADQNGQLTIWPNPTTSSAQVMISHASGMHTLRIIDMYGKVVKEMHDVQLSTPLTLDLNDLAKGMYLLQADQSGITTVTRLVKE